jgi:hypothetical protein
MRTSFVAIVSAIVLVPLLALAGPAIPGFDEVDANSDGVIDRQEFQAAFPEADPRAYEAIAGEQGTIGPEQWEGFRDLHQEGERMHGPGFHDQGGGGGGHTAPQ